MLAPGRLCLRSPRVREGSRAFDLGDPKVEDFHLASWAEKDVGRLDVAVDDALGVCRLQRIGDLRRDVEQVRQIEPMMAANHLSQGLAFEKLHDDEVLAWTVRR